MGAQSGWKCAGMPSPLSHACLAGAFATGAPAGLGRGDLELHRDLMLISSTAYSWGARWWIHTVGASATTRGQKKRVRACNLRYPRPPRRVVLPSKATSKGTRSSWPGLVPPPMINFAVSQISGKYKNRTYGALTFLLVTCDLAEWLKVKVFLIEAESKYIFCSSK